MTRIRFRSWIVVLLGCTWIAVAPVTNMVHHLSAETHAAPIGTEEKVFSEGDKPKTAEGKESNDMFPVNPENITVFSVLVAWLLWNERGAKAAEKRHEQERTEDRKERRKILRYIARTSKENNTILNEIRKSNRKTNPESE